MNSPAKKLKKQRNESQELQSSRRQMMQRLKSLLGTKDGSNSSFAERPAPTPYRRIIE